MIGRSNGIAFLSGSEGQLIEGFDGLHISSNQDIIYNLDDGAEAMDELARALICPDIWQEEYLAPVVLAR